MARPKIIWTDAMLEELVCEYPVMSNEKLAQKLGVCERSVIRKAKEMRLTKAFKGSDKFQTWTTVERMFGKYPYKKIAQEAGVSIKTVMRIGRKLKLQMEKEDVGRHRSEGLKKTLRVEKSRIVFGLEQKTDRRIGHDKARTRVLTMLAQHGYITIKGSMTAYYSVYMRRADHIEAYAVSIGVNIEQWETEEL